MADAPQWVIDEQKRREGSANAGYDNYLRLCTICGSTPLIERAEYVRQTMERMPPLTYTTGGTSNQTEPGEDV